MTSANAFAGPPSTRTGVVHGTWLLVLLASQTLRFFAVSSWSKSSTTFPSLASTSTNWSSAPGPVTSVCHTRVGRSRPGPPKIRESKIHSDGLLADRRPAETRLDRATARRAVRCVAAPDTDGVVTTADFGSSSPEVESTLPFRSRFTTSSPPSTGTPCTVCWNRTTDRPLGAALVEETWRSRAWCCTPKA